LVARSEAASNPKLEHLGEEVRVVIEGQRGW
jgi:hypothetical protein